MKLVKLLVVVTFIILVGSSAGFPQDRRGPEQPSDNAVQQQQLVEKQKIVQDLIDEKKEVEVTQTTPTTEDLAKPATFESTVVKK